VVDLTGQLREIIWRWTLTLKRCHAHKDSNFTEEFFSFGLNNFVSTFYIKGFLLFFYFLVKNPF